jgi:hypothetical protein
MSKYEPLPQFLSASSTSTRTLTFQQIERVLGFKLPKSAYEHEAWWSNNATGHSHAKTWLSAGWRTQDVDIEGRKVTFHRTASERPQSFSKRDPWGCMADTITIFPGTDLTAPGGESWNAEQGRLLNE